MQAIQAFLEQAKSLDAEDSLGKFRSAFHGLDDLIYLDGNTLGPLPRATAELLADSVEKDWGRQLIRSWNSKWLALPEKTGNLLAPLIGAGAGEV